MARFTGPLGLCFLLVFCVAAGCAGAKQPDRNDLLHRRFVLESVDGAAFSSSVKTPDIEFNENFRVSGQMCNRYTGQGELANGVLTVRQMASTKMLCVDQELNALEQLFGVMLREGAAIDLSGTTLTLRQGGHVLVFTLRDWVH